MKIKAFLKNSGQTSLEYLLLVAVSVGLGLVFFKKFQQYLLDNPNSYIKTQLKFYERLFDPSMNYKKYRLPR
jgi:hypothetical protein